jgi:hypothetical protein
MNWNVSQHCLRPSTSPYESARVDAADGRAVWILDLREVRAPLDRIALRPHDRLLAREGAAALLGFLHELRHELPGSPRLLRVHAVDAEHRRRVQHVAGAVADLVRHAGPGREIAVAGAVDEHSAADREAAGLRLDEHGLDAIVARHDGARRERME